MLKHYCYLQRTAWEGFEIGLAISRGSEPEGIYYDFLEIRDGVFGVIMVNPLLMGRKGLYTPPFPGDWSGQSVKNQKNPPK